MSQDPSANPVINLPAVVDLRAVGPLKAELMEQRGKAVTLDGSAVERLGGLGLQLLLSAIKTWQADGHALIFLNVSKAMNEQWLSFGASPTQLVAQDAA
ncbi:MULTISPECIES: STAS domain-containing protein [unclassified Brevundimonas]|uniref:STAS domain-containing protein n=1 Tax=unclassified Brevundimonas TaxID=2622653 RepID=UPI0025BA885F|nr:MULTISPECIES: STAS domain-containing protein [unclassified Brevundimonas]